MTPHNKGKTWCWWQRCYLTPDAYAEAWVEKYASWAKRSLSQRRRRHGEHRCVDYCPIYGPAHRYSDWTYWGYVHPRCDCGYEDESRTIAPREPRSPRLSDPAKPQR